MSEPFIGEIRMFAGTFAPRSWAFCDGQLLATSQNEQLFSLFGTIYGGDGRTTFGLPDLRGRLPIHMGSGPGLIPRNLGAKGGTENETLAPQHLPVHTHPLKGTSALATEANPTNNVLAEARSFDLYIDDTPSTPMSTNAITSVGGGQQHANVMPFLCIHFIVSLFGIYPSRN